MPTPTAATYLQSFTTSLLKYGWVPAGLFTFHMLSSRFLGLYDNYPNADVPMHFMGGFCIAYYLSGTYQQAERDRLLGKPAQLLHWLFVFAAASTSTIVWEFAEFLGDHFFGTTMQNGLPDTMLDMFLGMLGAIVLLAIHDLVRRKKR